MERIVQEPLEEAITSETSEETEEGHRACPSDQILHTKVGGG